MHNYHDTHGRMPPAVVYGEDGRPLYSWRVLILPFIEQEQLYKQFKLDEPWDSPHNIRLLPEMPGTYAPPPGKQSKVPPHHTVCHVFYGRRAAFQGCEGLKLPGDFPDGTSNTFLVVEAGEPAPWTSPTTIPFDPDHPLAELPTLFKDGFRAQMADCSRRWVKKETSEGTLRAAITRNGGDKLGPEWNE